MTCKVTIKYADGRVDKVEVGHDGKLDFLKGLSIVGKLSPKSAEIILHLHIHCASSPLTRYRELQINVHDGERSFGCMAQDAVGYSAHGLGLFTLE